MKTIKFLRLTTAIGMLAGFAALPASALQPIRAHPQNPHILEFRGQPTVLRTFAEQYSSVINSQFDYTPYLNVLQRDGMNLTRAFLLGFRLVQSDNSRSPLVVAPANFVQPWRRSSTSGSALDGLGKWDFAVWNEDYFVRLNAFAQACSDRGIVIELTLFCSQYDNSHWVASPFHPANNVQGYGPASHFDSMRLVNANLVAVQEAVVRRIVREVNRFDNIYYEIQNEPFWNDPGVKDAQEVAFHNRMLAVIRDEESRLPNRHLVAHNFPQYAGTLSGDFNVINEHYPAFVPGGPTILGAEALLRDHYSRGKILALDETATSTAQQTRLEAWMFILGGGGIYNGLDVVNPIHTEQSEAGDNAFGNATRGGIRNLGTYINGLHLVGLRRNLAWITGGLPAGASLQAMAQPGQHYVAYLHHGRGGVTNFQLAYTPIDNSNHVASPVVTLGQGTWRAVWTRPSDLMVLRTQEFSHAGGAYTLAPVTYQEDVALRIDRIGEGTGGGDEGEDGDDGGHGGEPVGGFVNGSFESGHQGWSASGNQRVQSAAPNTLPDGINYVTFNSGNTAPNGLMAQTFVTTPGRSYLVSFHLGVFAYNGNEQRLQVDVTGNAALVSKSFSISGAGGGSTRWLAHSLSFTADRNTSTLTFRDRSSSTQSLDLLLDHVRVTDSSSGPANTAPVAVADSYLVNRNAALVVPAAGVLGNDTDSQSNPLTAVLDAGPDHGTITLNANGGFTYTPASGYTGADSFTYHANDGALDSNVVTVGITVSLPGSQLIVNGSFEAGLTGWTAGGNLFIASASPYVASNDSKLVAFNAENLTPNAVLSQTFATSPGTTYLVAFDVGVLAYNNNELRLQVEVTGSSTPVSLTFPIVGGGGGTTRWLAKSLSFTAVGTASTLTFRDRSATSHALDLLLDHVRVTPGTIQPVPPPAEIMRTLAVESSPTMAVNVTLTPPDHAGQAGGTPSFSRNYPDATAVDLTAPPASGIYQFQKWRKNGVDLDTNAGIRVIMDGNHTLTAVYVEAAPVTTSLTNGSFESGYQGWSASGNQRIQSAAPNTLPDGVKYVDFNFGNTTPNGVLTQTFATNPGQTYLLSFHIGVLAYNTHEQRLQVEVTGNSALVSQTFPITGAGNGSIRWLVKSLSFTADSAASTLTFRDRSPVSHSLDLLLDNVRIENSAAFVAAMAAVPDALLEIAPLEEVPLAAPSIARVEGAMRIAMVAVEPGWYGLERSADLITWNSVAEREVLEPGPLDFTDHEAPQKQMFYRIARYGAGLPE